MSFYSLPCFQTPPALLCKCDISSGTKSCIFLCGNTEPLLAGSPPYLGPFKSPFVCPRPTLRPNETRLHSVSPQCSAASSLTAHSGPANGDGLQADFQQQTEPMAHALPSTATLGQAWVGAEVARRTSPNGHACTCFPRAPLEDDCFPLVNTE